MGITEDFTKKQGLLQRYGPWVLAIATTIGGAVSGYAVLRADVARHTIAINELITRSNDATRNIIEIKAESSASYRFLEAFKLDIEKKLDKLDNKIDRIRR
jgi:hypothetical protein